MRDPRVEEYARVMVDTAVGVQPGWQVLVGGGFLARPLLEEICKLIGQRGAYALGYYGDLRDPIEAVHGERDAAPTFSSEA